MKAESYKLSEVKIPEISSNNYNTNNLRFSYSPITKNIIKKVTKYDILNKESYLMNHKHNNFTTILNNQESHLDMSESYSSSTLYCLDCSEPNNDFTNQNDENNIFNKNENDSSNYEDEFAPFFNKDSNDNDIYNHHNPSHSLTKNHNILIPKQTHLNIKSKNHLKNLYYNHQKEVSTSCSYDKQYIDCLNLIQIMMKKKMSISNTSIKDFMEWKYDKKAYQYYNLDRMIKLSEKKIYGKSLAHKLKPKTNHLTCPSGRKVDITTIDIDAAILDLLTDPDITNPSNLIFQNGNIDNPFLLEDSPFYDDLDQSGIYQATYKERIQDPSKELLCPIIIYIDETNLDSYSKLVLHPVVITLGIYKRSTRNLQMSWRLIGYLPNFEEHSGHKQYSADQKMNDYHFCLRYILDGLEQIQKLEGLDWEFAFPCYREEKYKRLLKFPLSHVVSDAKENDMICGRMGNRCNTTCLARDCDITIEQSDQPNIKCNFHSMYDLEKLSKDELKKISFKKIVPYLAFSKIDFGVNPYGINASTPCEPLHQINGGIIQRLPTTFINRLSTLSLKILDIHVSYLCTHFSRQCDRMMYNLKPFRNGISSVSKLTAKEKISRVLAIYLTLLTSDCEREIVGEKSKKNLESNSSDIITQDEYNCWVKVFEETLIFTAWCYYTKHPKSAFKGGRKSIVANRLKKFMNFYNKYAYRKEGKGNKYLKFHQISHLWFIIRLFSALPNIDSGRNESHHKKKKQLGSHTQKRVELFDTQTASKEYVFDLFLKAMKKFDVIIPAMFETKLNTSKVSHSSSLCKKKNSGSSFIIIFDYENECVECNWLSYSMKKNKCIFPPHILDAFYKKFEGYNHGKIGYCIKSIHGFTEFQMEDDNENDILIRACPNYRNEIDWFDWIVVDWGNEGKLEGQVLLFVDFDTINLEKIDNLADHQLGHEIIDSKMVAFIHSSKYQKSLRYKRKTLDNSTKFLSSQLCCFREMEDIYQIISIDTIVGSCFVIVDSSMFNDIETYTPGCAKNIIVVEKLSKWHLKFIDYNDSRFIEDGNNKRDNDYPSSSSRFFFEG